MNEKKMVVSDYDQTFYISDEDIEKNKAAVNKFINEGNIFVIATGRSYFDFINKLNIYNFAYDYVIINHGTTIIDKLGNIIENHCINNSIISDIQSDLDIESSIETFCCNLENSRLDFSDKNLTKIRVKYISKEKAMEISKLINEKYKDYVNAYYVSYNAVEIISNETDKSQAIQRIISLEKIDKKEVYTIGDGYSDVEMIKKFDGYCMRKSVPELLEICNGKILDSVSDLFSKI